MLYNLIRLVVMPSSATFKNMLVIFAMSLRSFWCIVCLSHFVAKNSVAHWNVSIYRVNWDIWPKWSNLKHMKIAFLRDIPDRQLSPFLPAIFAISAGNFSHFCRAIFGLRIILVFALTHQLAQARKYSKSQEKKDGRNAKKDGKCLSGRLLRAEL